MISKAVSVAILMNCFAVAAHAGYTQKLKCVSTWGPYVNFGQTVDEVVLNVLDGDPTHPTWVAVGTFGPSSAFAVPMVGGLAKGDDMLLANPKTQFLGQPSFVVSNGEALVKSATFRIKGKLKKDLRSLVAAEMKQAANDGYSTESLASAKQNVADLIDKAEASAVDSELQCSVQGTVTK